MNRDFWIERWSKHEIGFHQSHVNPYLTAWWPSLDVPGTATVFVPLCGKSADMHWLRQLGHQVIGVEVARDAVRAFFDAWQVEARVSTRGPFECWEHEGITLLCGDFFDLQATDLAGVDAVFDRAALIALPHPLRAAYARKLRDILPVPCVTLLVAIDYLRPQMDGPPFAVSDDEVRVLFEPARIKLLLTADVLNHPDNARLRSRGLTALIERVYRLDSVTASIEPI